LKMSNSLDTKYSISEFHPSISQEVRDYFVNFKVWKSFYYSQETVGTILSKFEDPQLARLFLCRDQAGNIVSTIGAFKWTRLPYYTINSYTGSFGYRVRDFKEVSSLLWTTLVKEMEKERRHSFYWCIRNYPLADLSKKVDRPQLVDFVPYLERYHFNIEDIVVPGRESRYEVYRGFYSMGSSNEVYVIKRASLKAEFFLDLTNLNLAL
jgi:hypothetical protein